MKILFRPPSEWVIEVESSRERTESKGMVPLSLHAYSPAAWIEISGEDCSSFLQGQFSNDLVRSDQRPVTYGLWLDAKGKVLADSFVFQQGPDGPYAVFSYFSPASVILERLEKYIIADDVELGEQGGEMHGYSLWGERLESFLAEMGISDPGEREYGRTSEGGWIFRGRRSRGMSIDLLLPAEAGERFMEKARAAGAKPVDEDALRMERILSGIPAVPQDIGPRELPQEGGLDVEAVSFNKGCYLGQEVMARLRSMGQVRKALVPVAIEGAPPPLPASLFQGEKEVGEVRSAAVGEGGWMGLALIRKQALAGGLFSFEAGGRGGTLSRLCKV
ncbi:MAG: hypothetical protein WD490_06560 [Opitutales bacterium]